jgi:hypothetical protein
VNKTLKRLISLFLITVFVITHQPVFAFEIPGLPKIPSIPGLSIPDPQVLLYEKIGESLGVKAAIHIDAKKQLFPKTEVPENFKPVMLNPSSLEDLNKPLEPGDYMVRLMSFCTQWSVHVPGFGTPYRLGRADGARVGMITSFLIRGQMDGLTPDQLQNINWLLQSGVPISQWNETNRKFAEKYLPEFQNELKGDILDQMRGEYQNFVNNSPIRLPDFDNILTKIPLGKEIIALRKGRDVLTNRSIAAQEVGTRLYDATAEQDGRPQKLPAYEGKEKSPWTEIMPGVIGRYQLQNARAGDGSDGINLLQFRVLPQTKQLKASNKNNDDEVASAITAAPTLARIAYGGAVAVGGVGGGGVIGGIALIVLGTLAVQALINVIAVSKAKTEDDCDTSNISELNKGQNNKLSCPHRGRIQIQGSSPPIEKSWSWAQSTPPKASEALAQLDALWDSLALSQRMDRIQAYASARGLIQRSLSTGGIDAPFSKSFRNFPLPKDTSARIDIEVTKGRAFVP